MSFTQGKEAFDFIDIHKRAEKPRSFGFTMVLDKGLGLNHAEDIMEAASSIDIVKLAWATPRIMSEGLVSKKINLYKKNKIRVGNGGTLLEIAFSQDKVEEFLDYSLAIGLELIEVSNGVIPMNPNEKAAVIRRASSMGLFVVSEVGKKDPCEDSRLSLPDRIKEAKNDLDAGAHYVIIEAREAGKSIGIYDDCGGLKEDMAKVLVDELGIRNIMFEAPEKSQQSRLILLFGSDVNLGNIRPEDVIALETLRRGIRGDTLGKIDK